ncbi:hypothetical protein PSTG_06006 [Puccinia striiformis f. sp. tritici PST-78]|uniref:Tet-like 2OG-Fe(II) oxygenase domain-containing protein n=1 Tax=Puccinia striiformis f. sp. tritici PST-78 TaxID=1165861 RepID=A0A0L0VPC8_9BASI|nr:hypothetical protein PSTG_06006 [Puccinia striiformis f. sp. tritici PST-78]
MQNSSNPLIPKSFPLENQSPSNHSSLPDAEYETDDWDGEYKIDENDGEYKTDDPDAEYETDDPDGEYKIDENDGEYKTDDPDAEYETDDPDGEYKINENDPECLDLSNETCQLLSERARKTIKNTALHSKSFFPGCKPQLLTMTKNLKKQSFSIDSHTFSTSRDLIITNTGSGKKVLCLVSFHPSENRDSTYDQLAQLIEDSHLLASHCSNLKNKDKISDRMAGIGFRGGYEKGKTVGTYAVHKTLNPSQLELDQSLQEKLPDHNRWSDKQWESCKNNPEPICSNVIVTSNDFSNKPHCDTDKNLFTYGIFSYINRSTGTPTLPPSNTLGHGLRFPEYNCNIDFGSTPGIIEVLWKSNDIEHHTIGPPDKLKTTRSTTHHGCSFRISHQLVSRASSLSKLPHGKRNERVMYQNECSSKKSCKK